MSWFVVQYVLGLHAGAAYDPILKSFCSKLIVTIFYAFYVEIKDYVSNLIISGELLASSKVPIRFLERPGRRMNETHSNRDCTVNGYYNFLRSC